MGTRNWMLSLDSVTEVANSPRDATVDRNPSKLKVFGAEADYDLTLSCRHRTCPGYPCWWFYPRCHTFPDKILDEVQKHRRQDRGE